MIKKRKSDFLALWQLMIVFCCSPINSSDGKYVGCFQEEIDLYKTSIFAGNVQVCLEMCESLHFRYAVLSPNDKCSCTNDLNGEELKEAICNTRCSRNKSEYCGGVDAQSYYDTGLRAAGPPSKLGVVNKTDTVIVLSWGHPQQPDLAVRFVIRATVLKSFANYPIFPHLEWTIEGTGRQFEMLNLHPGTQYNISVTSICEEDKACGSLYIIEETLIGLPEPAPEDPEIIKESDSTITIEISPGFNNNGPISLYRIIVMFINDDFFQPFDESLLAGYESFAEDGVPYYITAEISKENITRHRYFVVGDGECYRGYNNTPLPKERHVHICLGIISRWNGVTKTRYAIPSHEQHTRGIAFLDMDDSQSSVIALSIACTIFGVLLMGSVFAYCYLRLKTSNRLERLSDVHELSVQGPMVEVENNGFVSDEFSRESFKTQLNSIMDSLDMAQKFPRNAIRLNVDDILGKGSFGEVLSGTLYSNSDLYDCQVHVISDDMDSDDQALFLKEMDQVARLMPHDKFLYFFGVSASPDWIYVIFESLQITLKKRLVESRIPETVDKYRFSSTGEEIVLQWVYEIAMAMEYMEANSVIHRKLNSYSIYITSQNQVKLALFGATGFGDQGKQVDISRWMPPEVLLFHHYSGKGDVWSFGCVAWECCTLGATLYANITSLDLLPRIRNGLRPEQAAFISRDLHQLFINCWQLEPSERPDFEEIAFNMRQILMSPRHSLSFDRDESSFIPYYLPLLEFQN